MGNPAAELTAWLRLSLTPGVGDVSARRLLTAFGLPQQVFDQPASVLATVVSPAQADALCQWPAGVEAQCERTLEWLDKDPQRHILTLGDAGYPSELLEMADPPLLLYLQGHIGALSHPNRLAVVGSRNPTAQGQLTAHDLSRSLAAAGVCIVSGLALGVDGAAHAGALDAGGTTIAVVGTGLDRVYPRRHLDLAHRIAQAGLLVSEYPLGTPPNPGNFPKRNRIIAGLCQGTLVVEAALASGSLITARLAAEMGREVFAIPGSIHSPQAKGCHQLIRQGAKLVETAQDVMEDLRLLSLPPVSTPVAGSGDAAELAPAANASATPSRELGRLLEDMGHAPIGLDGLQARTGLSTAQLQAWLMELELDGHIARSPGGLFQRLVRA